MDAVFLTVTNVTESETADITGEALDTRGAEVDPSVVFATTDGRFALVRWKSYGAERPRLIRVYLRLEAAVAANSALHGGNPVAEAKSRLETKRRGTRGNAR